MYVFKLSAELVTREEIPFDSINLGIGLLKFTISGSESISTQLRFHV